MIANNFSAREVKTTECWIKFRMYLIRVQQQSNSYSTGVHSPSELVAHIFTSHGLEILFGYTEHQTNVSSMD